MNRRIFCVLLVIAIALTLSACGQSSQSRSGPAGSTPAAAESAAPEETASPAPSTGEGTADGGAGPQEGAPQSDILIAYFSWSASGNTEKMAAFIREQTGGDLLKIGPSVPYPTDYDECTEPERDGNQRPAVANLPDSLSGYDTIFIGYHIWWHTAPMIIGTFLKTTT